MSIVEELYSKIEEGREGKNIGLKTGLPKLDWYTGGFQKGVYKLIFGQSGSAKSSYVIYSDVYRILKDYPDKNILHVYFSLEMSSNVLLSKLLNLYIYEEFGVEISYMDLMSIRTPLSDNTYLYVQKARTWLESIAEKFIIYDKQLNADGFYAEMMKILHKHGEFKKNEDGRRTIYIPNDDTLIINVIVDHLGLLTPSKGRDKKQEIDLCSSYCVRFREVCGVSFDIVMQENRNAGGMDRRKADLSEPTAEDIKDETHLKNALLSCKIEIYLLYLHCLLLNNINMSEKIEISKESIVKAMEFCHTREDLVKYFNVSLSTIKRRLKEFNLSTFSRVFDESLFLKLYNDDLSDSEIARKLDVSSGTISAYRRKLGLEKNFKYKNEKVTKDIFELSNTGYSIADISGKLNLDQRLVEWTLSRDIVDNEYILNDIEYQVFLGCLLGDGSISKGAHTSRFCFTHSEKQKEYGIWKSGMLKNVMMLYTPFDRIVRFDKRTNHEYVSYYSWTKHLKFLKRYRDKWYINGVKRIQKDDLFKLDALGLAIWFQDDGYKCTSGYYISTLCFPYEDMLIVKDYFHEKWGIEVKIQKNNEIYIPAKYRDRFTEIVKPYIHDVCKYKLIESL